MNIGSYEKPLTLNYSLPERNGLLRSVKTGDNFFFKDREPLAGENFLMNLISNPNLTKSDLLIGSYLYCKLWDKDEVGEMFWTSTMPQLKEKLGDRNGHYSTYYNGVKNTFVTPFPNLIEELSKINIKISNEVVLKSLMNLHQFHYITITTKHGNIKKNKLGTKLEKLKIRSEYRHIRLCEAMVEKPISNYWQLLDRDLDSI